MVTGKHNILRLLLILVVSTLILLLIVVVATGYFVIRQGQIESAHATTTAEAVKSLNETYGSETQVAIENFESQWLTLKTYKEPSFESELATGPYLDYFGFARQGQSIYDEPFWLITKSAFVRNMRVLEFSPDRFKALAYVVKAVDKISPQGKFLESLPLQYACSVYVFAWEDEKWKMAAYFNATQTQYVERDWRDAPDWLKQIIGDLPEETIYYCDKNKLEN